MRVVGIDEARDRPDLLLRVDAVKIPGLLGSVVVRRSTGRELVGLRVDDAEGRGEEVWCSVGDAMDVANAAEVVALRGGDCRCEVWGRLVGCFAGEGGFGFGVGGAVAFLGADGLRAIVGMMLNWFKVYDIERKGGADAGVDRGDSQPAGAGATDRGQAGPDRG